MAARTASAAVLRKIGLRALLWVGAAAEACLPAQSPAGAGEHVGDTCQRGSDCGAGLTCHYEGSPTAQRNVCRLEVGRCRFDRDCGPQQMVCRRFGAQLGVCEQTP